MTYFTSDWYNMRLFVTMVIANHGHGPTMSLNVSRFKSIHCKLSSNIMQKGHSRLNFISHWICTEICVRFRLCVLLCIFRLKAPLKPEWPCLSTGDTRVKEQKYTCTTKILYQMATKISSSYSLVHLSTWGWTGFWEKVSYGMFQNIRLFSSTI